MGGYIVWEDNRTATAIGGLIINDTISNLGGRITKLIKRVTEEEMDKARANPPWTPRTGKAQEGLTSEVLRNGNTYEISVYFDPDIVKAWRPKAKDSDGDGYYRYGAALEMLHERRFEILVPTIERIFVKAMNEIQRLLNSPRRRDR